MAYYTRVLSKDEDPVPSFEELARLVRDAHPDFKLTIESGDEEDGSRCCSPAMTRSRSR
jgi:hypothetical protein